MRGHIVKGKSDRTYYLVLSLGWDSEQGKYKQRWITFHGTRDQADERLRDLVKQVETGTLPKPGRTTFGEFIEKWLEEYAALNLSPTTCRGYRQISRHLIPALGKVQLHKLSADDLQRYYAKKGKTLSAMTLNHHHTLIHKVLKTALKLNIVSHNAADNVDIPKPQQTEMQTWEENEVAEFLEAAKKTNYHAIFYTALYTGMRRSELMGLSWRHVDLLYMQIRVERGLHQLKGQGFIFTQPKNKMSRRTVAISPSLALTLKAHHDQQIKDKKTLGLTASDDDLVFSHPDGQPLSPDAVSRGWERLIKKTGLRPIRLHDARHTHATLLLKQGVHPKVVQERLGHAHIATTLDTYSHVSPGLQEAAAQRFDEHMASNAHY